MAKAGWLASLDWTNDRPVILGVLSLEHEVGPNMTTITYRSAAADDAPAIAHVEVASKRESVAEFETEHSMGYQRSLNRWSGYIAGTRHPQLAKLERTTYVACDGLFVVGYLGCHHAKRKDWWQADAELQQIYVLKPYQRRGIGETLFSMMVVWLRDTGVNSVGVGFHADNPYGAFYIKMGGKLAAPGLCFWDDLRKWSPPGGSWHDSINR